MVPCRLPGLDTEVQCGSISRPLSPKAVASQREQRGSGGARSIDIHFAVLPAVATHHQSDPVVFLAGGPGQSAMDLAGTVAGLMRSVMNQRDVILVDQRGTGRSAPLACRADQRGLQALSMSSQVARLQRCRTQLERLPYGDLKQFTTEVASQDLEAVRRALGLGKVNLVGGSYGTRAALDYLRQYPGSVRRVVIDGVAPPDMVLPQSSGLDAQAAFDGVLTACAAEDRCAAEFPAIRKTWRHLLSSLPRNVEVSDPMTGEKSVVKVTADVLIGLAKAPLYAPAFASGLPAAIAAADAGNWTPLVGLGAGLGASASRETSIFEGMHFSVICAEDAPLMSPSLGAPGPSLGDFTAVTTALYAQVCRTWPKAAVDPAFYTVSRSSSPVLLLSGAADPVTPPRHAQAVATRLGQMAVSVVVPNTGHGTLGMACTPDLVHDFLAAPTPQEALARARQAQACYSAIPRPLAFIAPVVHAGDAR